MNAKDTKRVEDIRLKSMGHVPTMENLAKNMANKITNVAKAEGRYMASVEILGEDHSVTQIFKRRISELNGSSVITRVTQDNDTTADNTIYFSTASAVALWNWEFTGQISDGMWENTTPHDHWKVWCNLEAKIGKARRSKNTQYHIYKAGYNLGALKQYVGDRMLAYGKFGKAVGNDILNMGSEIRSTIESFPNEVFNLEEFKKEILKTHSYRSREYYWRGLEQRHVDAYYQTTYTEKEMNEDIKMIKKAMKNPI